MNDKAEQDTLQSGNQAATLPQGAQGGEVLISGVDIGPKDEERANVTPTLDHARFAPLVKPKPSELPALDTEDE